MPVYFIGSPTHPDRPIKIGYSDNPEKRLKQIQNMSPVQLEILNTFDGSESDIHEHFSSIRLHSEWFKPTDELIEFIKSPFHPNNSPKRITIHRSPTTLLAREIDEAMYSEALPICKNCNKSILVVSRKDIGDQWEWDIFDDKLPLYCPICGGEL